MNRNKFIKTCGLGCVGMLTSGTWLIGCIGTKYIHGSITDNYLIFPTSSFENTSENNNTYRKYVVVENNNLQYPIVVFRYSEDKYGAFLMKCTHQGTELQVFGDRLQCPAHGSEFSQTGSVQNGPANQNLRSFPILSELENLKINLS